MTFFGDIFLTFHTCSTLNAVTIVQPVQLGPNAPSGAVLTTSLAVFSACLYLLLHSKFTEA